MAAFTMSKREISVLRKGIIINKPSRTPFKTAMHMKKKQGHSEHHSEKKLIDLSKFALKKEVDKI